MWGWISVILGAAVGVGSAAVAIFVEGANAYRSSPYPPFFAKRQLLAYDVCLLSLSAWAPRSRSERSSWRDAVASRAWTPWAAR
jgi:hypothetical protein